MTHIRSTLNQVWFGPADAPLAGTLHRPATAIRGGVVICPPVAYEATCAGRSLRALAERLADQGLLTLRVQYAGTGNSSGRSAVPGELDRWVASVVHAVEYLRSAGVAQPSLVGLRMGAALACAALSRLDGGGSLALWSPVASGPVAAAELRGWAAITPGPARYGDSLNVLGNLVHSSLISDLKRWDPYEGLPPETDVLLVHDPDWTAAPTLIELLHRTVHSVQALPIVGASDIFERDAELAKAPNRLLDRLTSWLSVSAAAASAPATLGPEQTNVDAARLSATDGAMDETFVRIGSQRLTGVLTRPQQGDNITADVGPAQPEATIPEAPAVIFLNNGVAGSAGPARLWVQFARQLALLGVAALRLELSGLGDSPDPPRHVRQALGATVRQDRPLSRRSGGEVAAAITELRDRGYTRVVVMGLCSGALLGLASAAYLDDPPDAVLAVNPPLYHSPDVGLGPSTRRLWAASGRAMAKRPLRAAVHTAPSWVRILGDRASVLPAPERLILAAASRAQVTIVFSHGGKEHVDLTARSTRPLDLLNAPEELRIGFEPDMDHSMFDARFRPAVFAELRALATGEPSRLRHGALSAPGAHPTVDRT